MRVRALAEMIQEAFARETGARPELIAPEMTDRPAPYYVSVQRAAAQGLRLTGRLEDAVSETVRFCLRHRRSFDDEIQGVAVTPLRRIPDERGAVFHMLSEDDAAFERFGEIYFSLVYPGVVKGWHRHRG